MRMGQAFSRALDPSRPPLFVGMGSLDLLPEEAWHAACLPAAPKVARPAVREEGTAAEGTPGHQGLEEADEDEEEGEEYDALEQYNQEESSDEGERSHCLREQNDCCVAFWIGFPTGTLVCTSGSSYRACIQPSTEHMPRRDCCSGPGWIVYFQQYRERHMQNGPAA